MAAYEGKYSTTLNRQMGQAKNFITLAVSRHYLKRSFGKKRLTTNLSTSKTVAKEPTKIVDCSSITLRRYRLYKW